MPQPELILRNSREVIFTSINPSSRERVDAITSKADTDECPIAFTGSTTAIPSKQAVALYRHGADGVSAHGSVAATNVLHALVSPNGKFLVTYSALSGAQHANVTVWDTKTLEPMKSFQQHSWPVFFWSSDAATCLRFTTNAVLVLRGDMHNAEQIGKIAVRPVKGKEYTCEMQNETIVLVQPSDAENDGAVQLFDVKDVTKPCNTFPLENLDSGDILWSPSGSHAIVITCVDTDKSNSSYYGSRGVILVDAGRRKMKSIKLPQGSMPHDICWNPTGAEFIIVHGKMPQNGATIYGLTGAPLFEFASAPRNIACWAPNGRTIALGGSGSLNGEFVFWDRQNLETIAKCNGRMGSFTMKCSSYSWSPCSRYFMCAVLASRMQVGNCVTIWTPSGHKYASIPMDHLLEARWVPYDAALYADVPFIAKYQSAQLTEKKPALYVPKHRSEEAAKLLQRGNAFAAVKKVTKPTNRLESDVIGGVVAVSVKPKVKKEEKPKVVELTPEKRLETEKKIRALQKKSREIEKLKEADPETLTEAQLEKMQKAASVEADIIKLTELLEKAVLLG